MVINKHLLMVYWAYYVAIRKVVFSLYDTNISLPSRLYNHLRPPRGCIYWLPDPMVCTTFKIMYIQIIRFSMIIDSRPLMIIITVNYYQHY